MYSSVSHILFYHKYVFSFLCSLSVLILKSSQFLHIERFLNLRLPTGFFSFCCSAFFVIVLVVVRWAKPGLKKVCVRSSICEVICDLILQAKEFSPKKWNSRNSSWNLPFGIFNNLNLWFKFYTMFTFGMCCEISLDLLNTSYRLTLLHEHVPSKTMNQFTESIFCLYAPSSFERLDSSYPTIHKSICSTNFPTPQIIFRGQWPR